MRRSAFVLGFALLCCCHPEPPRPPPPDNPGTIEDCRAMCANIQKLGCDFYASDCVDACWNIESSGTLTMCPMHVAKAKTCQEAKVFSQCDSDDQSQ